MRCCWTRSAGGSDESGIADCGMGLPNTHAAITGVVTREVINAAPTFILRATSSPALTVLP